MLSSTNALSCGVSGSRIDLISTRCGWLRSTIYDPAGKLRVSADAFFGVFARYNAAVWPVAVGLWLAAVAALIATVRRPGAVAQRWMAAVLAALWAWSGVVYHAVFFTTINPAAWAFSVLFVVEDTGSAVKGNIFDIFFPNVADARRFGTQTRKVTILS